MPRIKDEAIAIFKTGIALLEAKVAVCFFAFASNLKDDIFTSMSLDSPVLFGSGCQDSCSCVALNDHAVWGSLDCPTTTNGHTTSEFCSTDLVHAFGSQKSQSVTESDLGS